MVGVSSNSLPELPVELSNEAVAELARLQAEHASVLVVEANAIDRRGGLLFDQYRFVRAFGAVSINAYAKAHGFTYEASNLTFHVSAQSLLNINVGAATTEKEREALQNAVRPLAYWGIAKRLNDNGVPSWGKGRATTTRKGWGWSYIGILLKHPAVEGEYHPAHVTESGKRRKTGERIENVFPRAVDADLVARARASASKRWQTRSGRYAPYARNLFSTLVRCKHCGGLMAMRGRAKKDGGYSYLQCDSAARHTGCEYSQFFNYRIFERAALDAMLHLALDERFFQREDLSGPLAIRLAELNRAIENKKAEAKRLVRKMARFDDEDQDEFDEELRAIKREQRELEAERVRVERDLEAARGRLAPNVHLQRVWEVRDALADD
ncbi:MAG: zinc ribbon domain-containing protein, partial [Pseudomonadota bacterium]|nr:zinc ribbon domain-containing protein [Pseudomonadota bacterium]